MPQRPRAAGGWYNKGAGAAGFERESATAQRRLGSRKENSNQAGAGRGHGLASQATAQLAPAIPGWGPRLIRTRSWGRAGPAALKQRGLHGGSRQRAIQVKQLAGTMGGTMRGSNAHPGKSTAAQGRKQLPLGLQNSRKHEQALPLAQVCTHLRSAHTWPGASRAARSPSSWWGAPCWPCCAAHRVTHNAGE